MSVKYIIIQKKNLKVPLLAGDGDWEVAVGRNVYCCDIFLEALFASLIYDPGKDFLKEIRHYITERIDKKTTPVHVDNFIKSFKEAHKPIQVGDVSFSDAQLLGNDTDGCCVPIYKYIECVTVDEEKMLLEELADRQRIPFGNLFNFFLFHLSDYDSCFYPKWGADYEAEYIAINFLRIHGFHVNEIQRQQDAKRDLKALGMPVEIMPAPELTEEEIANRKMERCGVMMLVCSGGVMLSLSTSLVHNKYGAMVFLLSVEIFILYLFKLIDIYAKKKSTSYRLFSKRKTYKVIKAIFTIAIICSALWTVWFCSI